MMKPVHITLVAILLAGMTMQVAIAERLPQDAQREVDQMKEFVREKTLATEKRILRKKQDTVRALERYEKTMDSQIAKNLIKLQLVKYRKQIKASEATIHDQSSRKDPKQNDRTAVDFRSASRIINFRVAYFYPHPVEKYKHQKGELQFFKNGTVHCTHRTGEKVEMHRKWRWKMKHGKLEIMADDFHGPIYVTKKNPREIYLDWKGAVNKKNVAKQN